MVNPIHKSHTPAFDHSKFDALAFELKKMGYPFIVVMQDTGAATDVDRIRSMGNFDEFEDGINIMSDILHKVADSLSKIDEIENPKNTDN